MKIPDYIMSHLDVDDENYEESVIALIRLICTPSKPYQGTVMEFTSISHRVAAHIPNIEEFMQGKASDVYFVLPDGDIYLYKCHEHKLGGIPREESGEPRLACLMIDDLFYVSVENAHNVVTGQDMLLTDFEFDLNMPFLQSVIWQ